MLQSLNCPNCNASYNPLQEKCEYCGSYIINVDVNNREPIDYNADYFSQNNKKYVCGICLDDNEYPIRICTGAYIKSIWKNVTGWLVLTNKRFILINFKASVVLDIPISDISDVESGIFGLTGNLHITYKDEKYKFNTTGYTEWSNKINEIR